MKNLMLGLMMTASVLLQTNAYAQEWNFSVTLDDKAFGSHSFKLTGDADNRTLKSEARFNYKLLFINAYRYHHVAEESWRGDCLQSLKATTEENGDEKKVSGKQTEQGFVLDGAKETTPLATCAMTFAYWNPKILAQTKLLNPQTGDYLDSKISLLGDESITVRGEKVAAKHYVIETVKFKIDLWYSPKNEWLALQSTTPDNHKIVYSLK